VGKAGVSRECAPDGVPTIPHEDAVSKMVGTAPKSAFAHPTDY
jgi:hypothetical protein